MKLCLNTISFVLILIYIFSLFVFFSYIYNYIDIIAGLLITYIQKYYIGDGENNMDNEQQYSLNLRTPDHLIIDITSTSMATTWEEWTDNLKIFFIAFGINDTKQKKALLLYLGGKELQKIHRTLNDESDTYEKVKELLDSYFKPKVNVTFERNKFYNIHQMENEIISVFVTRLKDASRRCNFENYTPEPAIVDRVISKCTSNRLRCRLLCEPKLDLKTLLEISFTTESAEQQATEMEKHEEHNINKVTKNDFNKQFQNKFNSTKPL